ncbi:hypothetical protein HA466_0224700 [Hirschfeldia incana]|nr:hypothetical protein HA466_0224700 [Hirschfeldia incana]
MPHHLLPSPNTLPIKKTGRCTSTVDLRLFRFCKARNVKRVGELMCVDMLLQDAKATFIQVTVNVHRLKIFMHLFSAGSLYTVSGFDITRSSLNFKLSESPVSIRFNDENDFKDLTTQFHQFMQNVSGSAITMSFLV